MTKKFKDLIRSQHTQFIGTKFPPQGQEDIKFLSLALAGEVGELCNIIKKWWRGDGTLNIDEVGEEMSNIRVYLELLSMCFGMDLDQECERKNKIVEQRLIERSKS